MTPTWRELGGRLELVVRARWTAWRYRPCPDCRLPVAPGIRGDAGDVAGRSGRCLECFDLHAIAIAQERREAIAREREERERQAQLLAVVGRRLSTAVVAPDTQMSHALQQLYERHVANMNAQSFDWRNATLGLSGGTNDAAQ